MHQWSPRDPFLQGPEHLQRLLTLIQFQGTTQRGFSGALGPGQDLHPLVTFTLTANAVSLPLSQFLVTEKDLPSSESLYFPFARAWEIQTYVK